MGYSRTCTIIRQGNNKVYEGLQIQELQENAGGCHIAVKGKGMHA